MRLVGGRCGLLRQAVGTAARESRGILVPFADRGGVGICLSGRSLVQNLRALLFDRTDFLPRFLAGQLRRQLSVWLRSERPFPGTPNLGRFVSGQPTWSV